MALEDLTGTKYLDDLVSTNPVGSTDPVSDLDGHIRGIKNVLLLSFPNITGAMTVTHTQLNTLQSVYGGATLASSDDVIDNFPSGTLMVFQQTAAPTGWTKGVTHNDKAFRVVTGTASSGGTDAFSTTFSASKATESHTLTTSEIPSHSHTQGIYFENSAGTLRNGTGSSGGTSKNAGVSGGSGITGVTDGTGGDAGHTHDITMDIQYIDVILASKD